MYSFWIKQFQCIALGSDGVQKGFAYEEYTALTTVMMVKIGTLDT